MKLRHAVTGMLVFAILLTLFINFYDGARSGYALDKTYVDDGGKDIADRFKDLNIVSSYNKTASSFYTIAAPSNPADLVGALGSAGIGVIRLTFSVLIFPFEIGAILLEFYPVPTILVTGLIMLLVVYVGFLILSAYLRSDV